MCRNVRDRRIGLKALAAVYRTHLGVLNIHSEIHVISGLNQRHFDPYHFCTPVISEAMDDLGSCFDDGSEVLIWHSIEELNDIYARLRREPETAKRIGEAGRRRVMAEHSYGRRLDQLAAAVG